MTKLTGKVLVQTVLCIYWCFGQFLENRVVYCNARSLVSDLSSRQSCLLIEECFSMDCTIFCKARQFGDLCFVALRCFELYIRNYRTLDGNQRKFEVVLSPLYENSLTNFYTRILQIKKENYSRRFRFVCLQIR